MPYVFFVLICLIWSSSFILMKKAGIAFTPAGVGAWRVFWGAAVLGLLCWQRGLLSWPERRHWLPLLIVILAGSVSPYVVQPTVVNHQGSAFMAMAVSCLPLVTVVLSIPLLRVFPTRRQLAGVCAGVCCLGFLLADGLQSEIPWQDFALAGTVPFGYAITNITIRRYLLEMPSLFLTFVIFAVSTVVLMPFAFNGPPVVAGDWWLAFVGLALLGVVGTGLATFWFNRLVQNQGPLFAGMVTNLVPIGAVFIGWLDQEEISMRQVAALVGIVVSVACVQFRAAEKTPASKPLVSTQVGKSGNT